MRTKAQYIERLGQMNRNLYSNGEKIDRLDPRQEVALHVMGLTFDAAWDPQSKELCTAASHLAGETINRFNHIHQNPVKLFFMNRRSCVISPPACLLHSLTKKTWPIRKPERCSKSTSGETRRFPSRSRSSFG